MLKRVQRLAGGVLLSAAAMSFLLGCAEALFFGDAEEAAVMEAAEPVQMYYTIDDGKTHFADDANRLTPFDKDGKPASRCYVFTCDDRKTIFVAYLERLTPEAKKKMEDAMKAPVPAENLPMDMDFIQMEGTEVKKPGADKWVKRNSEEGEKITNVACPDGKTEKLNIVMPGD